MTLRVAQQYSTLGLVVIPLHHPIFEAGLLVGCSCGGAGRGCAPGGSREASIGKHPCLPVWQQAETKESLRYLEKHPEANVGLLTGGRSNIFALDIDPRHGGTESLRALEQHHGFLPVTVTARTGSGGAHYIFRYPGFRVVGAQGKLGPGIDIRGDGNQIVVYPSRHRSGQMYVWEQGRAPGEIPFANAPAWLLEMLSAASSQRVEVTPRSRDGEVAVAVGKYLDVHPPENWPISPGDCPACQHRGCFHALPSLNEDDIPRWVCFSTQHEEASQKCGVFSPSTGVWSGDQLDLHAHAAGISVIDLLKREGFLKLSEQDLEMLSVLKATGDTRPVIICRPEQLHKMADEALAALRNDPLVFQRSEQLVTIRGSDGRPDTGIRREAKTPIVVTMSWSALGVRLTERATWVKFTKDYDQVVTAPPDKVVSVLYDGIELKGIPYLEGIVASPILRADGSLMTTPGHDPETGFFFAPQGPVLQVPANPSKDDARKAALSLLEVVRDFPFKEEPDEAAWLAAVLTVVGRGAYPYDPVPMFLIDSSTPGTGKSLLCDTISLIATGRRMARSPYVREDDEMRKRILAHCMAADGCVLVDNVPNGIQLGWPSLDLAITSSEISDRVLGESRVVRVPHRICWFATGNNIAIGTDMGRRVIQCRLEPTTARPDQRDNFLHPRLLDWVRTERPRLIAAALTILRAYFAAGRPGQSIPTYGGFEEWSGVVRNALVWMGAADIYSRVTANDADADPEETAHCDLLVGWQEIDPKHAGVTVNSVLSLLVQNPSKYERLRNAVQVLCPVRGQDVRDVSPKHLGIRLRGFKGRWRKVSQRDSEGKTRVDQLRFEQAAHCAKGGAVVWRVRSQGVA